MKKLYFLVILSLFATRGKTQINLPFPDSTGAWILHEEHVDLWGMYTNGARYFVNGTTVINGLTYNNVYYANDPNMNDTASAFLSGYHRMDSNKVYFQGNYASIYFNDTSDILLYDFNLNVGDSLLIAENYEGTDVYAFVDSLGTVVVGSQTLNKLYVTWHGYSPPKQDEWIEGIGSLIGYYPFYDYFESASNLACFHENNLTYTHNLFGANSCETVGVKENEIESAWNVYPNPSNGHFTISVEGLFKSFPLSYTVINTSGQKIQSGTLSTNQTEINLSSKGLYLVEIASASGQRTVKRIIVE